MEQQKLVVTGSSRTLDQLTKDVTEEFETVRLETPITPERLNYRGILADFIDAAKQVDAKIGVEQEVINGVYSALNSLQAARTSANTVGSSGAIAACVPGWSQPPTVDGVQSSTNPSTPLTVETATTNLRQWVDTFRFLTLSKSPISSNSSSSSSITISWNRTPETDVESLPATRASHTLTPLLDSNSKTVGYLMFGGFNRNPAGQFTTLNSTFLLSLTCPSGDTDEPSPSWKLLPTQGETPQTRSGHSANLLSENQVLIFGGCQQAPEDAKGYSKYFNDVSVLNITSRTWTTKFVHSPFLPANSSLFQRIWNYGYVPPADTLDRPLPREGHTADIITSKNELFVFGGNFFTTDALPHVLCDMWAFNLSTNTWRIIKPPTKDLADATSLIPAWWPTTGVTGHVSAVIDDRWIIYASGSQFCGGLWKYETETIIFDTQEEKWLTPKMRGDAKNSPSKRSGMGSCVIKIGGREMLVGFGGHYHTTVPQWLDEYYHSVHIMDVRGLRWLEVEVEGGKEEGEEEGKGKDKEEVGGSSGKRVEPEDRKKAALGEVRGYGDEAKEGRVMMFGGGAAYRRPEKKMSYYNDVYSLDIKLN
eukprot:TRINITY_DN2224_c0_g1_i1.p1 TRINITY_DN2224_c0_g1~~TRINITY_DN2224_c0_g1_i1.p1  ORF type:complete len:592 (-),score=175.59 TRINITY_DN2224_c0_g1_i1:66-1841(-)